VRRRDPDRQLAEGGIKHKSLDLLWIGRGSKVRPHCMEKAVILVSNVMAAS
jgi:hypothetical protein